MQQNKNYALFEEALKIFGYDGAAAERARILEEPIKELCQRLEIDKDLVERLRKNLNDTLRNVSDLEHIRTLPVNYGLLASSLDFIQAYETSVLKSASMFVTELRLLKKRYDTNVKGKLNSPSENIPSQSMPASSTSQNVNSNSMIAARTLNELVVDVINLNSRMSKDYTITLEAVSKSILEFNKYLKERFVKPEEIQKKKEKILSFFIQPEEPSITEYVKIKLIEDSPVLTDVLLELMKDHIPSLKEREIRKGRKKTRMKEVSRYDLDKAADALVAISDETLLAYYTEPKRFFENMGFILQKTNHYFALVTDCVKKLLESPESNLSALNLADIDELLNLNEENKKNLSKNTKRILNADIESIIQDEDEVLPENRKETDYFKVREKLLDLLYESMKQISKEKDDSKKYNIANNAVAKAVELKSEMDEIIKPANARRLRKDKQTDNEYYVGKQGDIGKFLFERAPTPNVKMDDVKGKSFDEVKQHLNEIVETASFPHIMRLSAPGGKVRSNILMIGPYGCGKTEIARAVCGDKRVIGASVSVAGTLTAWMHESVNNVKRIYDEAKQLFIEGREMKPVVLTLDEFDGWFAKSGHSHSDKDMEQIENILLEVLDGMGDYNGIITVGMTNKPWKIPHGILRRFRYVDIVGQLTQEERADLLKMFLEKSFPTSSEINQEKYLEWADKLKDAPGDVVRKVVDELHFQFVPNYLKSNPKEARAIQKILQKREQKKGLNDDLDVEFLKGKLSKHIKITPENVGTAIKKLLTKPSIRMQINDAKTLYEKTGELLSRLEKGDSGLMGMKSRDTVFEMDESDY